MSKDVSKLIDFDAMLERLTDRAAEIRGTLNRLVEVWSFDLADRSPGIAYVDEHGIPVTDLDLACFLSALVDRRAVITLPTYKARRAATVTEGQHVVSAENRHGRLVGLISHQEVFSLGINIEDANVIVSNADGSQDVGASRSMILQDYDGTWHDGWETIKLLPAGLDKEIFEQLSNLTGVIKFQYMIHPNRWPSFYGKPHILALVADRRIADEMKFLKSEAKRIRDALNLVPKEWPSHETVGESEPQKFQAFEADVDGARTELRGNYSPYETSKDGLYDVTDKMARYRQLQGQIRFQYRATQFAFVKEALNKTIPQDQQEAWLKEKSSTAQPRRPSWTNGKTWETGWKESPTKKTYWARMEIVEGIWLRFRSYLKTMRVAKE